MSQVTLPDVVTKRNNHSLSAWSVTPVTSWIVQFGGYKGSKLIGDTTIIEFSELFFVMCRFKKTRIII